MTADNRPLREVLDEISKDRLEAALKASRGNVATAAMTLGVTRQTVYSMIRRYGVNLERMGT